jgi:hypothetical protein
MSLTWYLKCQSRTWQPEAVFQVVKHVTNMVSAMAIKKVKPEAVFVVVNMSLTWYLKLQQGTHATQKWYF